MLEMHHWCISTVSQRKKEFAWANSFGFLLNGLSAFFTMDVVSIVFIVNLKNNFPSVFFEFRRFIFGKKIYLTADGASDNIMIFYFSSAFLMKKVWNYSA